MTTEATGYVSSAERMRRLQAQVRAEHDPVAVEQFIKHVEYLIEKHVRDPILVDKQYLCVSLETLSNSQLVRAEAALQAPPYEYTVKVVYADKDGEEMWQIGWANLMNNTV